MVNLRRLLVYFFAVSLATTAALVAFRLPSPTLPGPGQHGLPYAGLAGHAPAKDGPPSPRGHAGGGSAGGAAAGPDSGPNYNNYNPEIESARKDFAAALAKSNADLLAAPTPAIAQPEHCFHYYNKDNKDGSQACYTIKDDFRAPCFRVEYETEKYRCLPSYVIVGWPKSGTSSLFFYINHHANVETPRVKETDYFSHWVTIDGTPSYYTWLFPKIRDPRNITGEATTKYSTSLETPTRIKAMLPHARLIVMIRDPVEQVYSNYLMSVDWVKEKHAEGKTDIKFPKPFDEYMRNTYFTTDCHRKYGCDANWTWQCTRQCRRFGDAVYVDWLTNSWLKVFPREQLLILTLDELNKDPLSVMRKVEHHLSLPPNDYGSLFDTVVNVGGANRGIYSAASKDQLQQSVTRAGLDWETRDMLARFYAPHNRRLEDFLGYKLPWTKPIPERDPFLDSVKKHCFLYDAERNLTSCYTISDRFKNPCFYVEGERRCLPAWIIIGWPKCGTSSLYWYLTANHPNVEKCLVKETDYFEHWIDHPLTGTKKPGTPTYYTWLFPKISHPENVTGEATTKYGPHLATPARMFDVLPYVRLIVVLRNPPDQMYSNYLMTVAWWKEKIEKEGRGSLPAEFPKWVREPKPSIKCFQKNGCTAPALLGKPADISDWTQQCTYACPRFGEGIYVDWLDNWYKTYPRDQILVLRTEDLKADPVATLRLAESHIGIPHHDYGKALEHVVNTKENRGIYEVGKGDLLKKIAVAPDPLDRDVRLMLTAFYEPHNARLEAYLDRKFNWPTVDSVQATFAAQDADK